MKWNMVLSALVVSASLCGQSFGFELLDRMLGRNDCGCNSGCTTSAPACGCDTGAVPPNCEAACNAVAAPGCGCAAEPACGAAGPSCASVPSGCGCKKPCLLDCFRLKHKCCTRHCGCHHHCRLLGGCGAAAPSCGCAAAAPSCGCGGTATPGVSAPAEEAAPMPPAPTVDPSASYQKNRVLSVSSRTASLN